jgi:hypothetical protein
MPDRIGRPRLHEDFHSWVARAVTIITPDQWAPPTVDNPCGISTPLLVLALLTQVSTSIFVKHKFVCPASRAPFVLMWPRQADVPFGPTAEHGAAIERFCSVQGKATLAERGRNAVTIDLPKVSDDFSEKILVSETVSIAFFVLTAKFCEDKPNRNGVVMWGASDITERIGTPPHATNMSGY